MDKHEDTDTENGAQLEKTAERPTPAEPAAGGRRPDDHTCATSQA